MVSKRSSWLVLQFFSCEEVSRFCSVGHLAMFMNVSVFSDGLVPARFGWIVAAGVDVDLTLLLSLAVDVSSLAW
ncbi:hypothetical protein YC2023_115054 [Brassica napus]